MILTVAEVATATGGRVVGPPGSGEVRIEGASQDSRAIEPGALFVPIVAERDGHDYIAAALVAGAAAYLTTGRVVADPPDADLKTLTVLRGGPVAPAVVVPDTAAALADMGREARRRIGGPVVAVTGSAGKTTTKDLSRAVLAEERTVHASERSFNNELGVPLTLLGTPEEAQAVVVEMGARGRGHITLLCSIARPTVGVVTTVGAAHTSEFGSVAGVAAAKQELVEALPADGLAVLNAEVPEVAAMADATDARVVTFGSGGDLEAVDVELDDELTPAFRLVGRGLDLPVTLGARGEHLVTNAVAAALVAVELGVSPDAIAAGLAHPDLSPDRMQLLTTATGARVLNDAYNSNPLSAAAALRALARLPASRRTAVLGVMAELGEQSAREHEAIGELAASLGVRVIGVDAPDYGGEDVADVDEARALLGALTADDAVLVKGSRVAGLERLVELLLA